MFDFAIIGGGPAGSMAAWQLAKKGYKTIVFEEHAAIGIPVRCAGLVSKNVIKMHDDGIVNEIKGATIIFPNGKEIVIGGDKTHAFVIDRQIFDSGLAEKAMAEGAEYLFQKKVKKIARHEYFKVEEIKARYVIGADGPNSMVASQFNMGKIKFFNAIQGYGKRIDDEFVKVYISNEIAPGFFAWIVPADETRIGLATTKRGIRKYFYIFLKKVGMDAKKIIAALIPFGMRRLQKDGIALVGDAAGQVKATSGGGIYAALTAANILASCGENFEKYEKEFMKGFGKEIKRTIAMRKIVNSFNDKIWNKMAGIVEKNIDLINKYGDIDYPSIVVKEIMKSLFKI